MRRRILPRISPASARPHGSKPLNPDAGQAQEQAQDEAQESNGSCRLGLHGMAVASALAAPDGWVAILSTAFRKRL